MAKVHDHQGHGSNCKSLLNSLSSYIDGELEAKLCTELEHHLADCDKCRIVVDSLRKTVSLYHDHDAEIELPEDIRQRLFHALNLDDFLKT